MAVVKSDAMIMHEKWIEEVTSHRPKRTKETTMRPEAYNIIMVAAGILVILVAALSVIYH
jgi:hypothetical protein